MVGTEVAFVDRLVLELAIRIRGADAQCLGRVFLMRLVTPAKVARSYRETTIAS
jgi:hypothetical protein